MAFGVRSGHVTSGNITLPIGVRAGLTVGGGQVSLRILESAVRYEHFNSMKTEENIST